MYDSYFIVGMFLLQVFCLGDIITTNIALKINKHLEANPIVEFGKHYKYFDVYKYLFIVVYSLVCFINNSVTALIMLWFTTGTFFTVTFLNYLTIVKLKDMDIVVKRK
jgi:hypothetical protein